jgi:fructuronate reductase
MQLSYDRNRVTARIVQLGILWAMMQEEVAPLLQVSEVDLDAYGTALMERFANPSVHHKTAQIAMDGSQKIP